MKADVPGMPGQRWRPTGDFHLIICDVAAGRLSPLEALLKLTPFPTGQLSGGWPSLEKRLTLTLASEMDRRRARAYARTIVALICTPAIPDSSETLAHRIHTVFQQEALVLAELLGSFILELSNAARLEQYREAVFLARDAIPLYIIARGFADRGVQLPPLRLLDLNRGMFPDFPQRLPASSKDAQRLRTYIGLAGPGEGRIALVDTGVYGTLIRAIEDIGAVPNAEVFFLFSKHPRHRGFLNRLSEVAQYDARDLIEAICDTIECWPKSYQPSELWDEEHGPVAVARAADTISLLSSLAVYAALARWASEVPLDQLDPRRTIDRLSRQATPLMLRGPLPEWKHAQAWLAQARESAFGAE